ncbi:ketosteroid isomerase-like protein [Arthrobacter sp. 2762]|jgi:ketosteroid isomerase-like protein
MSKRILVGSAGLGRCKKTDKDDGVFDMGAAENAELVRRGYEAFNTGDLATLGDLFAEDAVWYAAGSGVLSGKKEGREAILAYFGELGARSQGSFQANVQDIVGGENHTVGIQQSHAENNGKTLDVASAIVFVLRDGKVVEGREFFEDTARADEFWT